MKPQLTFAFALFCLTLTAQVKFKVALLPDNVTYQILLKPDATWSAPANAVPSSQVTVRVPTGGFNLGAITSLKGNWGHTGTVVAPSENTGYDYIVFGLQGVTAAIPFQSGDEVALFNFTNAGTCTGILELLDNNNDPFMPPNSQSVNVGNQISVVGAGIGVNAYTGNYGAIPADCTPLNNNCGIEIFDIILTSPSSCGVADGSIQIVASGTGLPTLQYTINGGISWQTNPLFPNLASGDLFHIIVRDIAGICIADAGNFELEGPLAAVVTGVNLVDPDCGGSNGSITISAYSENGGILEYSMNETGPWQSSSTFSGLSAGSYPFYIQNVTSNCSSYIGNYTLQDCPPMECLITYELEDLGNGLYQVNLLSDTTWTFPNNITSSLQVTIKVPTGGFTAGNLTSQVTNVSFGLGSMYTSPSEEPGFDYISFNLTSNGTQGIPYVNGTSIPLFTFENTGTCPGDSIYLMTSDDPFFPPNSMSANVGQQLTVSGYGGADVPVCIGGTGAVACGTIPPPVPTCLITYEIEKLTGGEFQVSMIADTTWVFPNNISSSMQITVKVPAGGFIASNLTSLIPNVNFSQASMYTAPSEDPNHDYLSFILGSPGTQSIPYQKGVKTPLFTFTNIGTCQGGQVILMDNDTDPFYPPNSLNANVGQQLTVSGFGGADAPICISNLPAEDCTADPCATLAPGFLADNTCEGESLDFTNTTTSTETISSWNWDFGDNSAPSNLESPSHTYSTSGNFEVSLTVTTESGCEATFSEFVTVFPTPGEPPFDFYSICIGDSVQLQAPSGATAVWSPATGLSDPTDTNPFAFPAATTVYTLTVTNDFGCVRTSQVTVEVANKPIVNNVIISHTSDCGLQDGKISINATGVGSLQYSIDNGSTWQNTATYSALAPGTYIVLVRNATGSCPVAYNGNPVVITAPSAPAISGIAPTQPSGCGANGAITITAIGGTPPLLYSINGGATFQQSNQFTGLAAGSYQIVVTNVDSSCQVAPLTPITLSGGQAPTVLTPVADFSLCEGSDAPVSIQISQTLMNYTITPAGIAFNPVLSGSTLTFDVTAGTAGTQTVTVEMTTTTGCTITETFALTSLAAPTAQFSAPSAACSGGEVTLNYTGISSPQASLVWTLDGGSIVMASQQNSTDPDSATLLVKWTTLGMKTITLTVKEQGCEATETSVINIMTFDPGASLAVTDASCGENNGAISLSLTGSGIYTYNWSNGSGNQNLTGLSEGTYTVTVTETGSGCAATAQATVDASQGLTISSLTENPASDCSGNTVDGSLTVTISGGSGDYTYILYEAGNNSTPLDQAVSAQNTYTFNGLSVGAYQVEVTDENGCSVISTTAVTSGSGGLTATADPVNATCGLDNGSFSLDINGQPPFLYDFYKNNTLQASAVQINSLPLNVGNLDAASYVLIITDANGCIVPVVATIQDSEIFTNITTTLASNCGATDGSICIAASGGSGPYIITSNLGIAPSDPVDSLGCIIGLTEGVVEITITDIHGCEKTLTVDMGDVEMPELSLDSLTITNITCPGELGSIVSITTQEYIIMDANNTVAGMTPWTAAPAGTYRVIYTVGTCVAEVDVTISGVADWDIVSESQPEDCNGNNGAIILTASGANGGYTYLWSNGDTLETASGLTASEVYSVSVTDSLGCFTMLSGLVVDFDCILPCDAVFYTDTFNVEYQAGLTEICLPTNEPDIMIFDLVLDGSAYTGSISECTDSTNFYDYGMLMSIGAPPYQLDSWTFGGNTATGFLFNEMTELVAFMNSSDPLGNWILDENASSISGGATNSLYGPLTITHPASGVILTLQINKFSINHPSIFVSQTPTTHIFIAIDPLLSCADTLFINLLEGGNLPDIDTIFVQVPVGGTVIACIPTDELNGTLELMSNDCVSPLDPAQVNFTGDECLEIIGTEIGNMQACIILCDDLGVCDTTIVLIEVIDTSTELVIYTGFSPNGDGVNDYFKIKNIELYPDNEVVIYNRWGTMVYQKQSYSGENAWTGQYGDKILPDGSYFYILDVVINGVKKKFSGYLQLNR